MAEKTTKKAPVAAVKSATAVAPKPATAPAAKPAKIAKIDMFYFVNGVKEGEKLAPQARTIVNTLELHKAGLSRADLVTALTGKLNTRQPESRILTYYQKSLIERGYVRIEETETKVEPTTPPAAEASVATEAGAEPAVAG